MLFNLFNIVHPNIEIDFSALEAPFTLDEIDAIVKNMPTDKSPGPDGFNGAFLKRCHISKKISTSCALLSILVTWILKYQLCFYYFDS
jgi:hypothetical protein